MPLALVTGASRGIGRAVALRLARAGHHLIINYRSSSTEAESLASEIRAMGQEAHLAAFDVGEGEAAEAAVTEIVQSLGCPDILVNNAGITKDGLFAVQGRDSWEQVITTNLGSFYSITRPVLRQMIRRRAGRIITISSISGVAGNPGQVNYSASKAGLIGATKALALEVASRGITVNAVAPGFIETDMVKDIDLESLLPLIPMKRAGTPDDVAAAVEFLASEGAGYITGQVLSGNGGMHT